MACGDFEGVAQAFGAAILIDGSSAQLHFNLGHAYRLGMDWDLARTSCLKAAELFHAEHLCFGELEACAKGVSFGMAGIGPDAFERGLVASARIAFMLGCRQALGVSVWRRQMGDALSAIGDRTARFSTLARELVKSAGRIYFPRRAVGNALMAALCDAVLAREDITWV